MLQMKHQSDEHSADHQHVKGSEIFVGGLPRTITETGIREVFGTCGEIMEVRMIKDHSGNSKGYCFVRFTMKEAANKAVKEKSGFMLEGKEIGVVPSTEQDSLFLGNLRKDWTAVEFDKMIRQAFEDVVSVDLAMPLSSEDSPIQKKKNRGFAFVKFSSHAAAARAYRMGSKADFLLGGNSHPNVEWAQEEPEIDPEELAKIKIAFIRNLPTNADEEYLRKLFEPFGKLEKIVISRKGRSVGFVHFDKRLDLDNAIKEMNAKTVQGPNKGPTFKLQVEVAKPMDKNRKRAHDESQSKTVSRTPSNSSQLRAEPCNFSGGHRSKALKLSHSEEEADITDPYEAAVVSLPVAVKERLLRILRLGIATRFDIDIKCITSLNELPESTAIYILDQFMLSGADRHEKGAYLAGLISKASTSLLNHQVDKFGLDRNPLHLSRVGKFVSRETILPSLSDRVHLTSVHSIASHADTATARYDSYTTSPVLSYYSPAIVDHPLSKQTGFGRVEEASPAYLRQRPASSTSPAYLHQQPASSTSPAYLHQQPASSTSLAYLRQQLASSTSPAYLHRKAVSSTTDSQTTRPQVRFDPFTGEPYKFDPFTGEPILPESMSRHPGSLY